MTSTNIYTDQKNYPYVYRLDNLITNEFYIGYREANKVQSEKDLGTDYFTSAPAITEKFNEFQTKIIAEFFTDTAGNDAYDHEQYLIYCDWGNPLMLNKSCYYKKARFNNTGNNHSVKTKTKISAKMKGRPAHNKGKSSSLESRAKNSASHKGKTKTPCLEETKIKISATLKGNTPWNKGVPQNEEQILNNSNAQKRKFLSIIASKKSYPKNKISQFFPEFKQYY